MDETKERSVFRRRPCKDCYFWKKGISPDNLKSDTEQMMKIIALNSLVCRHDKTQSCCGHMHIKKHFNVYYRILQRLGYTISLDIPDTGYLKSLSECAEYYGFEPVAPRPLSTRSFGLNECNRCLSNLGILKKKSPAKEIVRFKQRQERTKKNNRLIYLMCSKKVRK